MVKELIMRTPQQFKYYFVHFCTCVEQFLCFCASRDGVRHYMWILARPGLFGRDDLGVAFHYTVYHGISILDATVAKCLKQPWSQGCLNLCNRFTMMGGRWG